MALAISYDAAFTCCSCKTFAQLLSSGGPYASIDELIEAARTIWWQQVGVPGWLEAFAAHPKIGDKKAVETKQGHFGSLSRSEQAAAEETNTPATAEELADWNQRYFTKFQHIFIICARGKPVPEILQALKRRYSLSPQEEIVNAAKEQMKITEMRLLNVLGASHSPELLVDKTKRRAEQVLSHLTPSVAAGQQLRSPITTHVLDTALGVPAHGMPLKLLKLDDKSASWDTVSEGVTNEDGRVGSLLPPSNYLEPGRYKMFFDTGAYFQLCRVRKPGLIPDVPFYPQAEVEFVITPATAYDHYHIPLLLSPYGFSTYKGS